MTEVIDNKTAPAHFEPIRYSISTAWSITQRASQLASTHLPLAKRAIDTVTWVGTPISNTITTFADPYVTRVDAQLDKAATGVSTRIAPYKAKMSKNAEWVLGRAQGIMKQAEAVVGRVQQSELGQKAQTQVTSTVAQIKETLEHLRQRVAALTEAIRSKAVQTSQRRELAFILAKSQELLGLVRTATGYLKAAPQAQEGTKTKAA